MKFDVSYRQIFQLAMPIMLGGVATNVINVTDTIFLARVGQVELAASALGGLLYFCGALIGLALGTGTQILVARRTGEGRDSAVGSIVDQAVYLNLGVGLLLFLILRFGIRPITHVFTPDLAVADAMTEYLGIRAWEIFAAMLFWMARGFYTGIGWTTVIVYATFTMAAVNILGDWLLVFGNWGLPRMGIAGAALASLIAEFTGVLIMLAFAYGRGYVQRFQLFRFRRPSLSLVGQQLNLSGPIVLQNLISMMAWFIFFMLIGYMGTTELAAANVVRSAYMVALIPVWGYGAAGNALVSNLIGQDKRSLVLLAVRRVALVSSATSALLALPFLVLPEAVLHAYTPDPVVVRTGLQAMPIVAVAIFLAGSAFVLLQAVTGTGATRFAFLTEVLLISIYVGYLVVVTQVLHLGQVAVWLVEIVYMVLMLTIFAWYLRRGAWRRLAV